MRFIITSILLLLSLIGLLIIGKDNFSLNTSYEPIKSTNMTFYLKTLKKGIVSSSEVTIQSEHKITEMDMNPGSIPGAVKGYTFPYTSRIQLSLANNRTGYIYFTENDKTPPSILLPDGAGYKKGTLSDLKVNDTILLEKTYNILGRADMETLSTKITKLNR